MTPRESDANLAADPDDAPDAKPRTATVLGLLALTSLTISFVGAYAVSVRQAGGDHSTLAARGRPATARWLLISFFVLLASFGSFAALVRYLSRRQLRQIDEMAEDDPRD